MINKPILFTVLLALPMLAFANYPYIKPGEHEARLINTSNKNGQLICIYAVPSSQGQRVFQLGSQPRNGCEQTVAYNDSNKLARQHYTNYHTYVSYISNPPKRVATLTDDQMKEVRQRRQAAQEQDKREGRVLATAVYTKEGEPPTIIIHGNKE